MFDHDALLKGLSEHMQKNKVFHRIGGKLNIQALSIDEWDKQMTELGSDVESAKRTNTGGDSAWTTNEQNLTTEAGQRTSKISSQEMPVIADEIPPFDITISMANEYGKAAVMVLYGVEILNQGSQMSMDNIQSQVACTFVARRLRCLQAVDLDSGKVTENIETNANAA